MNRFLVALSLILLGAAATCSRRVEIPSAVRETVSLVCNPRFVTADWSFSAGTAFLASTGSEEPPLLLTVIHIFGPAGGLNKQIPSDQLAEVVTGAHCQRLNGGSPIEAGRPLRVQDAQPAGTAKVAKRFSSRGFTTAPVAASTEDSPRRRIGTLRVRLRTNA